MDKRYKYKYRIDSARLKNHDYSSEGIYFITILTKNREHFFGEIANNKMRLSKLGEVVKEEWLISEKLRKHIFLDAWVIMPNHFHGIVIIDYSRENEISKDVLSFECKDVLSSERKDVLPKHLYRILSNKNYSQTPIDNYITKRLENYKGDNPDLSIVSPIPNSVATMIRFFKRQVKIKSKELEIDFDWQSLFYDVIIRDFDTLKNVQRYINSNVLNWKEDEFY
jgi:REP element-mobilizing transposase RayT